MRKGNHLEKGTVLRLIPEVYSVDGKTDYEPERSWVIGDVIGMGGSTVCYQAFCGNKTGRLKEYNPFMLESNKAIDDKREVFLTSYRELDRIRKDNSSARIINNYLSAYEILYSIDPETAKKTGAFIWSPDMKVGTTFEKILNEMIEDENVRNERNIVKLSKVINIMTSLTECVKVFHSVGLFNLDLKPANFLVYFPWDENMGSCQVSLFDLDTIKICTNRIQTYRVDLGTSSLRYRVTDGYSAPELYIGKGDFRSDIYSVGAIMYTALFSCWKTDYLRTYSDDSYTSIEETINDFCSGLTKESASGKQSAKQSAGKRCSEMKETIIQILKKTLVHNPNKRYDSCEELLEDLQSVKLALLLEIKK